MNDDAILEARRLHASLSSMRSSDTLDDAERLLATLANGDLAEAADALRRIEQRLPQSTLAGFVRVRIHNLAGSIATMQDGTPTPPSTA